MTTQIRIPGVTFTGTGATEQRIVTGALLLVDNSHPLATKTTAAAGTATYTNLAATTAQAAIGSALATVPTFDSASDPTHATIGYTTAGSPHFTSSVTVDVAQKQVGLLSPANLLTYLQTNNTHSFYFGLQFRVTRLKTPTGAYSFMMGGVTTQLGWAGPPIAAGVTPAGAAAGYPGSSDSRRVQLSTETTSSEMAVGITAADLSPLASTAPINQLCVTGPSANSPWLHNTPSFVLRSLWLVDLTVAGMTHAQAWALDQAAHQAAITDRWAADSVPTPLA